MSEAMGQEKRLERSSSHGTPDAAWPTPDALNELQILDD